MARLLWVGLVCCATGWVLAQHGADNCTKANGRSCADCLQAGPNCAWCKAPSFLHDEDSLPLRCAEAEALVRRGCPPEEIENPQGSQELLRNQPITPTAAAGGAHGHPELLHREGPPIHLQPQEVLLRLRVGEPLAMPLRLRVAEDYPVDLYYLMGLSGTRREALEEARSLAISLSTTLRNITLNFRVGLGTFGRGTEMPTAPPTATQQNRCSLELNCSSPLWYRHVLGLTPNKTVFEHLVGQQAFPDPWGSAGSSADALLEVATCPSHISWRRDALRLLLVSTNMGFHVPGNGGSGGHGLPHNGRCRLDGDGLLCTCEEPPSVAHLAQKLSENNIQTIFAVTPDVRATYEKLEHWIPKSTVETLSSDSSNITQLILSAYRSLSSEVVFESSNQLKEITIEYQSTHEDGERDAGEQGRKFPNISAGEEMAVQMTVTAHQCPGKKEPRKTMRVQRRGFAEELTIHLEVICDCSCQREGTPSSPLCYGSALECGLCRCNTGRFGRFCECSTEEGGGQGVAGFCQAPNSSSVCSGRGECVCGQCVCQKREKLEEQYSGQFCECDNFSCARWGGLPCGGRGRGRCLCGECECRPEYTGAACECPLDTSRCETLDGQICHGRGVCACGICLCDSPYRGQACELGPALPDVSAEEEVFEKQK